MKVTPETLTDEQILRLGRSCRDGTINDAVVRGLCITALGLRSRHPDDDELANVRQRICAAINARTGAAS